MSFDKIIFGIIAAMVPAICTHLLTHSKLTRKIFSIFSILLLLIFVGYLIFFKSVKTAPPNDTTAKNETIAETSKIKSTPVKKTLPRNTIVKKDSTIKPEKEAPKEQINFNNAPGSIATNNQQGNNTIINQASIPRTITEKQTETFTLFLSDNPKGEIKVIVLSNNRETMQYAEKIRQLIVKAGYKSDKVEEDLFVGNSDEISLAIQSLNPMPEFAPAIQKAFLLIGINAPFSVANFLPVGSLSIIVKDRL